MRDNISEVGLLSEESFISKQDRVVGEGFGPRIRSKVTRAAISELETVADGNCGTSERLDEGDGSRSNGGHLRLAVDNLGMSALVNSNDMLLASGSTSGVCVAVVVGFLPAGKADIEQAAEFFNAHCSVKVTGSVFRESVSASGRSRGEYSFRVGGESNSRSSNCLGRPVELTVCREGRSGAGSERGVPRRSR